MTKNNSSNADIYISIFDGLLSDKEAVKLIQQSDIIAGIEIYSLIEHFAQIKKLGLKCAAHDPQVFEMNNLGDSEWLTIFNSAEGQQVIDLIRHSDAPVVAFHCGFSAQKVHKMRAFPDAPVASTLYKSRDSLLSTMVQNILGFEKILNRSVDSSLQKQVLLEPMDYTRNNKVNWDIQHNKIQVHKEEIEKVFEAHGTNASLRWVCDIDFYKDLFTRIEGRNIKPIGFLFDVSQVFITANTKIHQNEYQRSIENYFEDLLRIIKDKIYQIHVNVPAGNDEHGYTDGHLPFEIGNPFSDRILRLTQRVIDCSANLRTITLEIRGEKNMQPTEFANLMIEQEKIYA